MNEVGFRKFLAETNTPKKVISDHVSRLKRIEKSISNCDLDEEYEKNECSELLKLCEKNYDLSQLSLEIIAPLPIGNYAMNTFKHSIKKYCQFRKSL